MQTYWPPNLQSTLRHSNTVLDITKVKGKACFYHNRSIFQLVMQFLVISRITEGLSIFKRCVYFTSLYRNIDFSEDTYSNTYMFAKFSYYSTIKLTIFIFLFSASVVTLTGDVLNQANWKSSFLKLYISPERLNLIFSNICC